MRLVNDAHSPNPWIQACVWLREEGCFDGKTQAEIIELCAKERQKIVETWDSTKTWVGTTWDSTTNSNGATVWSSKQVAESLFKTPINCSVYHYDYAETTNMTTTTASGGTKVYTPENTQGIYILNINQPIEGAKIKVKKVDADTGVALAGAEFSVVRSDTGRTIATLQTGADGTATTEKLDINTTYTVTETKAPNGYTIDDTTKTQTVTLTEDTTVTLTFPKNFPARSYGGFSQVHIVMPTRHRRRLFASDAANLLFANAINAMCAADGLKAARLNIAADHIRLCADIPPELSVADVVRGIKRYTTQALKESDLPE